MKRLFWVFLIILVIAAFLGGGFWLSQKNKKIEPTKEEPKIEVKKIVDDTVVSPTSSLDNNAIWFFNSASRLFRVDLDGNNLTEYPTPSLNSQKSLIQALWSPEGADFIAINGAGLNEEKNYFNSQDQKYSPLPINVKEIDWLPDGKRVVYIWQSTDGKSQQLVVANADTSGYKILKDVTWPDLVVKASPDGKSVLTWRSKMEGQTNKIYLTDLQTGDTKTILEDGKNLGARWLNSEEKFIFSAVSDQAFPRLYLYDLSSQLKTDLNLNVTLEKVVADTNGKFLYAAIAKKDNSGDYFIKLDLNSFKQEVYFEPSQEVRVKELFYMGNSLYFTSAKDGKLYSVTK